MKAGPPGSSTVPSDAVAHRPRPPVGIGGGGGGGPRPAAIALICVGAALVFAWFVNGVYPIKQWLALPLLMLWGSLAALHLSCLAMGARITVVWLGLRDRPLAETLVLSMATGVVAWVLAMYGLGALALYGRAPFFLLPVAFLAAGAGPLVGLFWRSARPSIARVTSDRCQPSGFVRPAVVAFGTLCLGLMYLQLFSPVALNYDSVWCHLTIAEAYAREGRIVAFPADYAKNVPQLMPLFHLWGFVVPGLLAPVRWMFALHNEFGLFVWTLVGVVAVVGWIIADPRRARSSWTAFFLFPGIFVYDSNLGGAADHGLAFFAAPVLLAAVRLAERPSRRKAVLFGIVAGGALLTKYQAVYLLAPAAGLVTVGWLRHLWRGLRLGRGADPSGSRGPVELFWLAGTTLLTFGLIVAPHFLRNEIFYRNPVYPFMQDVFAASRPRVPDGAYLVSHIFTDRNWQPQGTLFKKLSDALVLFFTFSFKPHYYYEFHHNVPSFGSLFTLLLPIVPLLGRQPRLWRVIASGAASILLWSMTFLVDRNLQTFLPVLVAATAAIIMLTWDQGWLARGGLGVVVLLQIVWGGDALFYSGAARLHSAAEIIASGFAGRTKTRFDEFQAGYVALGRRLPENAVLLLRGTHGQLGIDRTVYLDWAGFQGLIDYRSVDSVEALDRLYRSLGITHIARAFLQGASSKQEDVLLALYLGRYAREMGMFGGLELFALPAAPVPPRPARPVVLLGVPGYPDGEYRLGQLGIYESLPELPHAPAVPKEPLPIDPGQWPGFLRNAMAIVTGNPAGLPASVTQALGPGLTRLPSSPGSLQIFAPAP